MHGSIHQSLGGDFSVSPRRDSAGTDQSANIRKNESLALGFFIGSNMGTAIDIKGEAFGRLVALKMVASKDGAMWLCRCVCGAEVVRGAGELRRKTKIGRVLSCGCVTARTRVFENGVKCTVCDKLKPPEMFSKMRSGYQSACKACAKDWREKHADYLKAVKAQYHVENRERINKRASDRQSENKEQSNNRSKKWRDANPDRRKEIANAWVKRNPESAAQHQRLRQAGAKRAQPAWANKEEMKGIYKEARLRRLAGESCHVDHIVPLLSRFVSGLHCEANLQIIAAHDNQSKSNRYWPDMP